MITHETIINYWFKELQPQEWWQKSDQLDNQIKERFLAIHQAATANELWHWRKSAEGSLAEIIILDQFSRNIFRNQPASFSQDPQALALAQEAIDKGFDQKLGPSKRSFLYMPFMHSESVVIHDKAVELFKSHPDLANNLDFEYKHKEIIEKFGRYPHRNEILGRESTPEEIEFLKQPGSSF